MGILKRGLIIQPPGAPHSGGLYGKGIYFSDFFAKASTYCRAYLSEGKGLLALCQVALGAPAVRNSIDMQVDKAVKDSGGKLNSCEVPGSLKTAPAQSEIVKQRDGGRLEQYEVPCGKPLSLKGTGRFYSEQIVYNDNQVKLKYLVMVKLE